MYDMIDFVGTPLFLRITLRVAMATIHFHIAKTGLFLGNIYFLIQGIQENNLPLMKNCPGWCKVGRIRSRGTGI